MKKQFLFASAIFAGLFSLAACGDNNSDNNPNDTKPSDINPSVNDSQPSVDNSNPGDNFNGFSATVLYPDGTPAEGVMVQWCIGEVCFNAIETDESGVAKNSDLQKGKDYIVHVTEPSMPEGYTFNPNIYTSDDENMHITITLMKLNDVTGEGTFASPYVANEGVQFLYVEEVGNVGVTYFTFTATESAKYEIESIYDINAPFPQLPTLHEFDINGDRISQRAATGTGLEDNFKYTFDAIAGTTYIYGIVLASGSDGYAELPITITKL